MKPFSEQFEQRVKNWTRVTGLGPWLFWGGIITLTGVNAMVAYYRVKRDEQLQLELERIRKVWENL